MADIGVLPLPPSTRNKLQCAGFRTTADLTGLDPLQLAREAQLGREEALGVLKLALPAGAATALPPGARSARDLRVITFCHELDAILGGGVCPGQVTEFCGVPGVGKTQLGMQLALDVGIPASFGGTEGEAVYIDTEGSFMVDRCTQMADAMVANRKGDPSRIAAASALSREALLGGIHYFRARDHIEQVGSAGRAGGQACGAGGQVEERKDHRRFAFMYKSPSQPAAEAEYAVVAEGQLPAFLGAHPRIKLIVLDSVTFHYRRGEGHAHVQWEWVGGRKGGQDIEDMGQRTRQLAQMAQQLMQLAGTRSVAVVLMNHVTTKLAGASTRLVPALGDSWAHAATNRVILYWKDHRRFAFMYKSPSQPAAEAEYAVVAEGWRHVLRLEARLEARIAEEQAQTLPLRGPSMPSKQLSRPQVVFVGVTAVAHPSVRWWEASRHGGDAPETEPVMDVFGVRRRRPTIAPSPSGLPAAGLWKHLQPHQPAHTAPDTAALVCSGLDDSHRLMALEAARAGKSVYVESLERFTAVDVAELAAAVTGTAAAASPPARASAPPPLAAPVLMAGLDLRCDRRIWEAAAAPGGAARAVGCPLLYQAHASTGDGSLFDLGMQHVDAARLLLGSEPVEAHCVGVPGAAPSAAPSAAGEKRKWFSMVASGPGLGAPASELGGAAALVLTLRMESGAVATITLDRGATAGGGDGRQSVRLVGDRGQLELEVGADAEELQKVNVNNFLEAVLSPLAPPRASADDVQRAHAIMTATASSLASGQPTAVTYSGLEVLAGRAAAAVGGAADRAAAVVGGVVGRIGEALAAVPAQVTEVASSLAGAGKAAVLSVASEDEGVGTPPHSTSKGQPGGERKSNFVPSPEAPSLRQLPSDLDAEVA
eukprot:scaffold9.g3080.t1